MMTLNSCAKMIISFLLLIVCPLSFALSLDFYNSNLPSLKSGESGKLSATANLQGSITPSLRYELTFNNFKYSSLTINNKTISGIALTQNNQIGAIGNNIQLSTQQGPLQVMNASGGCILDANNQAVVIQNNSPCHIVYMGSELQRLQTQSSPQLTIEVFAKIIVNNTQFATDLGYEFNPLLLH